MIKIKLNGKNLYTPEAKIFHNNDYSKVYFALPKQNYDVSWIPEDLKNNNELLKIEGNTFILFTKENAFSFTSEEIKNNINSKEVLFGIILLDENNNIIPMDYEGISCIVN